MSYTNGLDKPDDYFNTKLYTGDGNSTQAVTGVGFQSDWIWIKNRTDGHWHNLNDSVRGAGAGQVLRSNTNAAESGTSGHVSSFDSDGFTVATGTSDAEEVNTSSDNYVAWCWLAGGTASSNTDGSITSSVSANTTAGFSICKYTGVTGAQTFGHSLGAVPKMVIVKNLDSTENWRVYHHSITASKYLKLNTTDAETSDTGPFSGTTPTSTLVYVGGDAGTCENGSEHIAYCFAEKKGYSKFGSYTGNGNADGTFVYTGFRPAWIMAKATNTTESWNIWDNKRDGFNVSNNRFKADSNIAEQTDVDIDFLSNGFKLRRNTADFNGSYNYIYMAFSENPFVTSTGIPCTAR